MWRNVSENAGKSASGDAWRSLCEDAWRRVSEDVWRSAGGDAWRSEQEFRCCGWSVSVCRYGVSADAWCAVRSVKCTADAWAVTADADC